MDKAAALFIFACTLLGVCYVNGQAPTLVLSASVHDQSFRHFSWIDFERPEPIPQEDHGMVQNTLNVVTRKPVYSFGDNWSVNKTVRNQTSYDTFFNDSPYTKLVPINLTLTQTSVANVYTYSNFNYFPMDGKGWDVPAGADEYTASDNLQHNFHFCLDVHARFAYKGGETFSFLGDDDVWVFINNQLIVDLGGPHTKQSASFSLDAVATTFGLVPGNDYRFDFFYCERHTTQSEIQLTTSLEIYCSYYDWCDECDGNGQSCCQAGDCDDKNPCTTDLCAVFNPPTVSCQNIPLNCTAPNICVTAQCVIAQGGCVTTNITCASDNNACTLDQCDPTQGGCIYPEKTCDDGQGVCTVKSCDKTSGNCIFNKINCDDSNACTTDTCDKTNGCVHTPVLCTPSNACNISSCIMATGCSFAPKNCNDNNACTADSCSGGQCQNINIPCDDNDACTVNNCNIGTGCDYSTKVNCNDNNACTADSCSAATGCTNTPISCDDGNACTTDSCDTTTGCKHVNVVCDDGNDCTSDTCVAASGCSYAPKDCNDNLACTTDSCGTGNLPSDPDYCSYSLITCNDNSACTDDSCSNTTGCVYQPITCTSSDPCTISSCDTTAGCQYQKLSDSVCNVCFDLVTNVTNLNCPATDLCHPERCYNNGGVAACEFYANVTCDDNNGCTSDSCTSTTGQCSFTTIPCVDSDSCTVDFCNITTGACTHTPINCDDGNNCTVDSCSGGTCSNAPISGCIQCGTGSCTTTDYCNPIQCTSTVGAGTCTQKAVNCDDGNLCTDDSCVVVGTNATCSNLPHDCTPDVASQNPGPCRPFSCDPVKGCLVTPVNCDDGNNCTSDQCTVAGGLAVCENDPICVTTDVCNPLVCYPANATCGVAPVNCDDNNDCTTDSCVVTNGVASCSNDPVDCPFDDFCLPATCNSTTGACEVIPVNCDDGIKCTNDQCNSTTGICAHLLNGCDDANNCTVDSCDNTANTTDGCVHSPLICESNICSTASCDPARGCVFTPIPCKVANSTDYCAAASCDETAGCLNTTRICLLSTLKSDPSHWVDDYPQYFNSQGQKAYDCFTATCDTNLQKCVVVQIKPWSTNCGVAYLSAVQKNAVISAGVIAGVTIAAVVFAALAGFGGKKGYDAWVRMNNEQMGGATGNPLYATPAGSGTSALYSGG